MSRVVLKTTEQIEGIRASAKVLSNLLVEIAKVIRPGITTLSLDTLAQEYIADHKGTPAFLNYQGFPNALCISVNDEVVHGIPGDYVLQEGDVISVDGGVNLNGYISDSAYSFPVGEIDADVQQLLSVTKDALDKGVEKATQGNRIGDISAAVQDYVTPYGYGIVKELVGHGVGLDLHEGPEVPNYGRRGNGLKLQSGMVLCIEPMINAGSAGVDFLSDGWTVKTRDGKYSAHYEKMVSVAKGQPDVLLDFVDIEEVLKERGLFC